MRVKTRMKAQRGRALSFCWTLYGIHWSAPSFNAKPSGHIHADKADPKEDLVDSARKLLETERNNESGVVNPAQVEVVLLGQLKVEDKDMEMRKPAILPGKAGSWRISRN